MTIPDYGASVEAVANWIAAGATLLDGKKLVAGETLWVEAELPQKPDTVATVFETGGTWAMDRNQMVFTLLLVTRAPRIADSRKLSIAALMAAVNGWLRASEQQRAGITHLRVARLPQLQPRDAANRVVHESLLEMTIYAPFDLGVDQ